MSECQITSPKMPYTINAINALTDNYIWVIGQKEHNKIAIVDPGDAQVCINYIEQHSLELCDILITHRHYDHTDGVDELVQYAKNKQWQVNVYGPATDDLPISTPFHAVSEGDCIALSFSVKEESTQTPSSNASAMQVLSLHGHTKGHIGFLLNDALFCGDTLFSAGCGRIFDGTAKQLWQSLTKIAALPNKTQIYCTHEYTVANINFALTIEPNNDELVHYFNVINERRSLEQSSIPTSLLQEKKINPFIRCHLPSVQQSIAEITRHPYSSELTTFTQLRTLKDNF